jgi:putative transposase
LQPERESSRKKQVNRSWTRRRVWLLKLGALLITSALYYPQSRGKNERFHRTLSDEAFAWRQPIRVTAKPPLI